MTVLLDLAAIRASNPLPSIVGASVKLIRVGNEWKACCPFHSDRSPSFTIFAKGERFYCFGCGASGDVFDYVQRAHGVTMRHAITMLDCSNLPTVVQPPLPSETDPDTTAAAVKIWGSARPIANTPAEAYLRSRGLDLPLPDSLRFARLGYGSKILPCLVALIADGQDKISGIQRTFLREDGTGKADVPAAKLSLGRVRGGAIRLAPGAAKLVITGGLEDGLSLQQELGQAVWVAAGEGNMPSMVLPVGIRSVLVGADNDTSGSAYARTAAEAFALQGRQVRILRPRPCFKDFNDALRGIES